MGEGLLPAVIIRFLFLRAAVSGGPTPFTKDDKLIILALRINGRPPEDIS
jgi:hypothetical protein